MFVSSFNVILGNNQKKVTIQTSTDAYLQNLSILNTYVLNLGGIMVDQNTARFSNEEAFEEFINRIIVI